MDKSVKIDLVAQKAKEQVRWTDASMRSMLAGLQY